MNKEFFIFKNFSLLKRKPKRSFLKITSLVLVLSFFGQELVFANPELKPISWNIIPSTSLGFEIPKSIALIEDFYQAPVNGLAGERVTGLTGTPANSHTRTLYLLQDAHTNESGQLNISKALDLLLEKEKIKLVFLEAGRGDDSLSFLRDKASLAQRRAVAQGFLKKGVLSGAEYLDLTSNHPMNLWGVENKELYWKSVDVYRRVAAGREKFQDYLKRIEQTVETLKPRIYNPSLLFFDQKREAYLKEQIPLTDYFLTLAGEAEKKNLGLLYFPHLQSLRNVLAKEKTIDFQKANEEQIKAVSGLSKEGLEVLEIASKDISKSPFKLGSRDHKEGKAFYALLEEVISRTQSEKSTSARRSLGRRGDLEMTTVYPELSKYLDYLKEAEKIDPKKLLEEQKLLENQIYAALIATKDEAVLRQVSESLKNVKGLFNLTLTPDEYDTLKSDPRAFDVAFLTGFLNQKIMELKTYYERAVFLEGGYDDFVNTAREFYELTEQRDREFLKNALEKMDKDGQTKAALIAGGYHTPNLKALLKSQGVSFVSLTPQVFHETNQKRYEKLLLGQQGKDTATTKADALALQPIKEETIYFDSMSAQLAPASGARLATSADESARGGLAALPRVILVEDNENFRQIYGELLLKKFGPSIEIVLASSVKQAKGDLIIVGNAEGVRDARSVGVPVIFLSGSSKADPSIPPQSLPDAFVSKLDKNVEKTLAEAVSRLLAIPVQNKVEKARGPWKKKPGPNFVTMTKESAKQKSIINGTATYVVNQEGTLEDFLLAVEKLEGVPLQYVNLNPEKYDPNQTVSGAALKSQKNLERTLFKGQQVAVIFKAIPSAQVAPAPVKVAETKKASAPVFTVEKWIKDLASTDENVWKPAELALKKMGEGASHALMKAITGRNEIARKRAGEILGNIGQPLLSDEASDELVNKITLPRDAVTKTDYSMLVSLSKKGQDENYSVELRLVINPIDSKTDSTPVSALDREMSEPVETPPTFILAGGIQLPKGAKAVLKILVSEARGRLTRGEWKDPVSGYEKYVQWAQQYLKTSGARLAEYKLEYGEGPLKGYTKVTKDVSNGQWFVPAKIEVRIGEEAVTFYAEVPSSQEPSVTAQDVLDYLSGLSRWDSRWLKKIKIYNLVPYFQKYLKSLNQSRNLAPSDTPDASAEAFIGLKGKIRYARRVFSIAMDRVYPGWKHMRPEIDDLLGPKRKWTLDIHDQSDLKLEFLANGVLILNQLDDLEKLGDEITTGSYDPWGMSKEIDKILRQISYDKEDLGEFLERIDLEGKSSVQMYLGLGVGSVQNAVGELQGKIDQQIDAQLAEMEEYNKRLGKRSLDKPFDFEELKEKLGPANPKFYEDGRTKPYHGLTTIAWVKPDTELFQKLSGLQANLKVDLEKEGFGDVFSFLEPSSFHMTVADIDPSRDYNPERLPFVQVTPEQLKKRVDQAVEAFNEMGTPGEITAQIKGIGFTGVITALVRFSNPYELSKVRALEAAVKSKTGASVREFTGHISLAYTVKYPKTGDEGFKKALEILKRYKDEDLGEFKFDSFDLTYFPGMNHFVPLVTKNLVTGEVHKHPAAGARLAAGPAFEPVASAVTIDKAIETIVTLKDRDKISFAALPGTVEQIRSGEGYAVHYVRSPESLQKFADVLLRKYSAAAPTLNVDLDTAGKTVRIYPTPADQNRLVALLGALAGSDEKARESAGNELDEVFPDPLDLISALAAIRRHENPVISTQVIQVLRQLSEIDDEAIRKAASRTLQGARLAHHVEQRLKPEEMAQRLLKMAGDPEEWGSQLRHFIEWISRGDSENFRLLAQELNNLREKNFLEIGPGWRPYIGGYLVEKLGFDARKVYAVDPQFKWNLEELGLKYGQVFAQRIEDVRGIRRKFDRILARHVFSITNDEREPDGRLEIETRPAVAVVDRLLKPGGELWVEEINNSFFRRFTKLYGAPEILKSFTTQSLYYFHKPPQKKSGARLATGEPAPREAGARLAMTRREFVGGAAAALGMVAINPVTLSAEEKQPGKAPQQGAPAARFVVDKTKGIVTVEVGGKALESKDLTAVVYQPTANDKHISYYTEGRMAELLAALLPKEDPLLKRLGLSQRGQDHGKTLTQELGIKNIRLYYLPLQNSGDIEKTKQILKRAQELYGIRVMAGHWAGLWGLPGSPELAQDSPQVRQKVAESIAKQVELYGKEPWLLYWQIGNENNYHVKGGQAAAGKALPMELRAYYEFMTDLALALKQAEARLGIPKHPVLLGNGDLKAEEAKLIDEFNKAKSASLKGETPWDGLALNLYHGVDFENEKFTGEVGGLRDVFRLAQEIGLPVAVGETGIWAKDKDDDLQVKYFEAIRPYLERNRWWPMLTVFEATNEKSKAYDQGRLIAGRKETETQFGILGKALHKGGLFKNWFKEENIWPAPDKVGRYSSDEFRAKAVYADYAKPVALKKGDFLKIRYNLKDGVKFVIQMVPADKEPDTFSDMALQEDAAGKDKSVRVVVPNDLLLKRLVFQFGEKAFNKDINPSMSAELEILSVHRPSGARLAKENQPVDDETFQRIVKDIRQVKESGQTALFVRMVAILRQIAEPPAPDDQQIGGQLDMPAFVRVEEIVKKHMGKKWAKDEMIQSTLRARDLTRRLFHALKAEKEEIDRGAARRAVEKILKEHTENKLVGRLLKQGVTALTPLELGELHEQLQDWDRKLGFLRPLVQDYPLYLTLHEKPRGAIPQNLQAVERRQKELADLVDLRQKKMMVMAQAVNVLRWMKQNALTKDDALAALKGRKEDLLKALNSPDELTLQTFQDYLERLKMDSFGKGVSSQFDQNFSGEAWIIVHGFNIRLQMEEGTVHLSLYDHDFNKELKKGLLPASVSLGQIVPMGAKRSFQVSKSEAKNAYRLVVNDSGSQHGTGVWWLEPSGARLATRHSGQAPSRLAEQESFKAEDAIQFSIQVYDATKKTGKIALGGLILDIELDRENDVLWIHGLTDKPIEIKNYKLALSDSRKAGVSSVLVSIPELRRALDQDFTAVESELGEVDNSVPVVLEIDLDDFVHENPKELVFPLLVHELKIARKQNAVTLVKGSEKIVQEFFDQAKALYPARQDFLFAGDSELPEAYRGAQAKRIAVVSVGEDETEPRFGEGRYFVLKAAKESGLPNFRAIFKLSIFEARIERLESSNPQFVRFLNAYRALTGGREITDLGEFIDVLSGRLNEIKIILKYAVPPRPVPVDTLVRIYQLMTKMAEQAA